jgi:hypothetical protein
MEKIRLLGLLSFLMLKATNKTVSKTSLKNISISIQIVRKNPK